MVDISIPACTRFIATECLKEGTDIYFSSNGGHSWLASTMTCKEFADKLFPKPEDDSDNLQPKPDCEMIYLELQKPGVTKMLL